MNKIKLSDLVLISDIDGTLLDRRGNIPPRNIAALERFTAKGGRFAVATGRALEFARPVAEKLPVNCPCVLYNGGVIYDFKEEKHLLESFIPDKAKTYIAALAESFPDCGALLVDRMAYYDIYGRARRFFSDAYPNPSIIEASVDEIQGPCYKALVLAKPERMKEIFAAAERQRFGGVRFVMTNPGLLEMLPEDSSKGEALRKLTKILGIGRENLVAIGDYYNDLEMLEYAGIGATMRTAPEELKALAQILVCDSGDGAVAELVEWLEEKPWD